MSKRYFGTDGIRGQVGRGTLTAQAMLNLAQAAGQHFTREAALGTLAKGHLVVIGKDTRESGDMIEAALVAGFTQAGMSVIRLGVLPTPAVAMATQNLGATLGVMITASHNPFHDNGVKFFGSNGCKIDDADEISIETLMDTPTDEQALPCHVGRVSDNLSARQTYIDHIVSSCPNDTHFTKLTVVLDCANGAAVETAPQILADLGPLDMFVIGNRPDGVNINKDCGSTHIEALSAAVLRHKADVGIALDGDADRLIMVDETGQAVDGDQLLGLMGVAARDQGRLKNAGIVATVMSNLGLERYLAGEGLTLERTAVGDRHVAERMRTDGYNIGGEQSGHLLMTDHAPTGDGMLAAVHVLARLIHDGRKASEVLNVFTPVPQKLVNVRYSGASPMNNPVVLKAIEAANDEMMGQGRVLVRASGTEPIIRVMAEGDDSQHVDSLTQKIAKLIENESKG